MRKLKSILLVDDDPSTNFLHELILKDAACADHFKFVLNGREAIGYLQQQYETSGVLPEIIFLDINMPIMNGWEFLEEFKLLAPEIQKAVVVVMLTTSMNPDDEERAAATGVVKAFRNKPISAEMIKQLVADFL